MLDLACLLIPQEIFPQSAVVTDTPLLRKFPRETNILRDIGANLRNLRVNIRPGPPAKISGLPAQFERIQTNDIKAPG